jgi:TP901 family phage tail tape measure protein
MAAFTPIGVEAVVKGLGEFNRNLGKINRGIGGVAKTAAKAAVGGLAALSGATAAIGIASAKAAIDYESAFAGVIKTTDGVIDEMGQLTELGEELRQGFRDLAKEIPVTTEELAGIGEIGGQLGIAGEDLLDFTEVIAAMGVATNLTTEEAAVQFAQLANIMGTTEREGSDAFSKLGSAIVELGNNMATTEADISAFASRIAGAGSIAGLTEADVLAIGAAMSSVGVQADAGGTAVQKVLLAINEAVLTNNEDMEVFAATAGLSAEEFGKFWEEDAGGAFLSFIEGLGMAGDEAIFILQELGLEDQRLIRSFLSLAGASGVLEESMDLSSKAWDENAALTKEAAQRYATTESQITIMKNTIKDLGITIGDVLLPIFNRALEAARPLIDNLSKWLEQNIPIAVQFLANVWNNVLMPALQNAWAFVQANVIPVLANLWQWFQTFLPTAMATAQAVFTGVFSALGDLWAAVVNVWETQLQPAFASLGEWLSTQLPGASAGLTSFWENTLKPALETVWEFILNSVIPALGSLAAFLIENIPTAIQATADFWENTLKPALDTVWDFIINSVVPALVDLVKWLEENVPAAIETLSEFWEETLKPALETVWTFITESLIPTIETLWTWLAETIPPVIEELATLWENTLKPALEIVWEFIENSLFPLLSSLWELLSVSISTALTALAGLWENVFKPALEAVWKFISEDFNPVLEAMKDFFDDIADAIDVVIGWIGQLVNKIRDIDLPDWMTPGSPTPLELGLRGMADAMRDISEIELPRMATSFNMVAGGQVSASPVIQGGSNITFGDTNINSGMDQAIFEERVRMAVAGALP